MKLYIDPNPDPEAPVTIASVFGIDALGIRPIGYGVQTKEVACFYVPYNPVDGRTQDERDMDLFLENYVRDLRMRL